MLEKTLSSDEYRIIRAGVRFFGQLMCGTDMLSQQVYRKFPDIHKFISQNILTISLSPDGVNITEVSNEIKRRRMLLKETLWALSNIAASPPHLLEPLIQD